MQARFRKDYDGEYVLTKTTFRNGEKLQEREWINNPIVNQHVSGRAAVIGSNSDLQLFDYKKLATHRGGLLGSKRLQTYASGAIWKDMAVNFFVTNNRENLTQIQEEDYQANNIVYTTTSIVLNHPGKFYPVPYGPVMDELALAIYLAAFDGHQEIFLLGYNKEVKGEKMGWIDNVNMIFRTYQGTKFYLVGVESNQPSQWKKNKNVKCMTYREFISYCDI